MYTSTQRLMRSRNEKVIAGVAGGIAHYLAVDPVMVRLVLIALCFTGIGLLLYPILWLVMPVEPAGVTANGAQSGAREVFVAQGSMPTSPRFDPMTGQPLEPEGEIPVNNVQPSLDNAEARARRNQLLGYALLIVGGLFLLSSVAGLGALVAKLLFPAILIGAGVYLLRRK